MPAISFSEISSLSRTKYHASEEPRISVMLCILCVSLFAVSFPGVSKQVPLLRIPHLVFFIGKHFGTGAILSTAFCHLLPDAFESLQDADVNRSYHAIGKWTGHIILGSLLSIFLIEYISTSYVDHLHSRPSAPPSPVPSPSPSRPKTPPTEVIPIPVSGPSSFIAPPCSSPNCSRLSRGPTTPPPPTEITPLIRPPSPEPPAKITIAQKPKTKRTRSRSLSSFDFRTHDDDALLSLILLNAPRLARGGLPHAGLSGWGREAPCVCHMRVVHAQAHEVGIETDEEEDEEEEIKGGKSGTIGRKRQVVGILILQLGIMIHSLVIGITLAITYGTDFTSLVTAIIFHQLFEGLSLGIRIAGLPPAPAPRQQWLAPTLSILFAITTPLGMGIGQYVFASTQIDTTPTQAQMRLTQGLMSGISAGMLIYAATVEMLAGDFVFGDVGGDHGHWRDHHQHVHMHGHGESALSRKVLAVLSLLAGATAMALVGLGE